MKFLSLICLLASQCFISDKGSTAPQSPVMHSNSGIVKSVALHGSAWQKQQKNNIRETVVRYLIAQNQHNVSARAYYVVIERCDPDPQLLARFTANRPPVLPGSKEPVHLIMQEQWSDKGVQLALDPVRFTASDQAQVHASMICGNLCGNSAIYDLHFTNGKWSVRGIEAPVVH